MAEYICARCASMSPTCCRLEPGEEARCFPLSRAEEERLAPHAGKLDLPSSNIVPTTREFISSLRSVFPGQEKIIAALFPQPGEHAVLPVSEAGECLFLGDGGCNLPRPARPWYCRLYPLWFNKGKLDRFRTQSCLISREARNLAATLDLLGLNEQEARALYEGLCRDWGIKTE